MKGSHLKIWRYQVKGILFGRHRVRICCVAVQMCNTLEHKLYVYEEIGKVDYIQCLKRIRYDRVTDVNDGRLDICLYTLYTLSDMGHILVINSFMK